MTVTATVKDGVVILPSGVHFPEGAQVRVEALEAPLEHDPLVAAATKLAKPRPHWPDNYVKNHGHYVSGEPKKP